MMSLTLFIFGLDEKPATNVPNTPEGSPVFFGLLRGLRG